MPAPLSQMLLKIFEQAVTDLADKAINFGHSLDLFRKGRVKYLRSLERTLGAVQILGMPEPAKLRTLYVSVRVSDEITGRRYIDPKSVSEVTRKEFRRRRLRAEDLAAAAPSRPRYGAGLLSQIDHVLLLGRPGGGKTTFLRYLALRYAGLLDEKPEVVKMPLFVSLRELSEASLQPLEFIVQQLEYLGMPHARAFALRVLEAGSALVLFDGYDEVSDSDALLILAQLRTFSGRFGDNKIVVSSRTASFRHDLPGFKHFEVCEFSRDEIGMFVKNWFSTHSRKKGGQLEKLMVDSPQISELATSPLLAALICILYDHDLALPRNRAELYDRCIQTMLREWDVSRGFRRESRYEQLSDGQKLKLLSYVAGALFAANKILFTREQLEASIRRFLDLIGVETEAAGGVLKEIESHHGLLVERARGLFAFSHLSLQEFLAAKYFSERQPELFGMLARFRNRWHEVGVLAAGMMTEATAFLGRFDLSEPRDLLFCAECVGAEAPVGRGLRKQIYLGARSLIDDSIQGMTGLVCHYEKGAGVLHLATRSPRPEDSELLKTAAKGVRILLNIDRADLLEFLVKEVGNRAKGAGRTLYKLIGRSIRSGELVKRVVLSARGQVIESFWVG